MAFCIDGRETMSFGVDYIFTEKHHSGKNFLTASKWIISLDKELDLAQESRTKNFLFADNDKYSWNVQRENNHVKIIGRQNGVNEYVGRFELSRDGKEMHGYPINHIARSDDKPHNNILTKLKDAGKISKRDMKKISGGKEL